MALSETVPQTRLDAINLMLEQKGLSAVASLAQSARNSEVARAETTLQRTIREVLSKGWHFNTEKVYAIDPDVDGQILVPNNTLKIDTHERSRHLDLVERDGKLYDRVDHTFVIEETVYVDLVLGFEFEDIKPESLRWYVTVKAARRYIGKTTNDGTAVRITQLDEEEAWARALQDDDEQDDRNMTTASPHVARMRRR